MIKWAKKSKEAGYNNDHEMLKDMFLKKGISALQIGKTLDISTPAVLRRLTMRGIKAGYLASRGDSPGVPLVDRVRAMGENRVKKRTIKQIKSYLPFDGSDKRIRKAIRELGWSWSGMK